MIYSLLSCHNCGNWHTGVGCGHLSLRNTLELFYPLQGKKGRKDRKLSIYFKYLQNVNGDRKNRREKMLCDQTLLPVTFSETPEGNSITFCTDDLGKKLFEHRSN